MAAPVSRCRLAIALLATALIAVAGCSAARDPSATVAQEVELPGVETSQLTPRERHEFWQYVRELPAPCKDVAVPIAQCVLERRACPACVPAAQTIAKAVREGMAREQVEDLYKQRFDASYERTIPIAGSPARGGEGARVVMVEFADFECPFCQRMAPELDGLWEHRKDKLRFVYKFMPLAAHPHGEAAARAAIAAQMQGKFWEMHRQLFANGEHLEPSDLERYAQLLGLDMDRFRADMQSVATTNRLNEDRKLADDLQVKGTPTIFIDGREYDLRGADLAAWVDQEIAARR
jgi:protein-disulfide isomerase